MKFKKRMLEASLSYRMILGMPEAVLIPRPPGNQSRRFPPSADGPPLRYGGFLTASGTPTADQLIGNASMLEREIDKLPALNVPLARNGGDERELHYREA